jgi:hypothetical protein
VGRGLTRVLDALRPHPHRGDVIAAGAVVLSAALLMVDVRMGETWEDGVLFVFLALGAALVYGMGMLAPPEGDRPRAYVSILLLAGLALAAVALGRLALTLGADAATSAGALTWVAASTTALAVLAGVRRNSAVCTLVAAVTGSVAVLALVAWVFAPESVATFRWILLLLVAGFVAGLAYLREHHHRHAVMLVDAAGLALLALGASFAPVFARPVFVTVDGTPTDTGVFQPLAFSAGFGWEVVLLLGAFGLIAFAAADDEAGPGYLGAALLGLAIVILATPDDAATLVGWPLLLLIVGIAGVVFGLRPRRELPPPPDVASEEAETRTMPPPTSL